MKIEIKSRSGSVLFSYEHENNNISKTLNFAIKECANLSDAYLRDADLRYANLRDAELSGANLSSAKNVKFSQCSFDMHGECGRSITAVLINGEIIIFCGCVKGGEAELREYIEKREDKYKKSRLFALEFVLKAINFE